LNPWASFFTVVTLISAPLAIYLLIGPLPWVLLFVSSFLGRVRMNRLRNSTAQLPQNPPHVTIVIPAKDEGAGINRCIESILTQDYPQFNIIAIDDRSSDDTGKNLDKIASKDSRLRVIHVEELPPGWLGKCHALHLGTRNVQGDWLLFVDSDVTLEPSALSSALALTIERKYDALSLLTRLECDRFIERLMLPPLAGAWAVMNTISLTNEDSRKNLAAANGQFFLIRRSAYESVGGHEAVKDQLAEDVELMRLLKLHDFKTRFFAGAHLVATRMHNNLRQMFNSWARIYSGTLRRNPQRILAAIVFVLLSIFTVYPAIIAAICLNSAPWLIASATHFVLMTSYLMLIYRWSGNQIRYALLAPAAGAMMIAIFIFSLRKCRSGQFVWRGTEFTG
jgi:cellulose synthase/poly-beta-1,6-N-acetylglucosamine synthase-like glycosyltransferase